MGIFEFESRKGRSPNSVCEDELTSRVFGILEIAGETVFSKWLKINGLKKIVYWPKYAGVDPDLSIYDQSGRELIVECKKSDPGSVNQIKREYNLAYNKLKGQFVFITANISRPDILAEAERELGLKEGKINWTTWMELYSIIIDSLNSEEINPVEKHLLIQLKDYLRWLRMGYNFGELMEKYKKAFHEGWLDIVSEKFKNFIIEIKQAFEAEIEKKNRYQYIRVAEKIKSDLFTHTWINLYSKKAKNVHEELYYFIYFDIKEFNWAIILAGSTKPVRVLFKEFLETQSIPNFTLEASLSNGHDIGHRIITSEPDFKKPDVLKKEIVDKSLEFIDEMDSILSIYKK